MIVGSWDIFQQSFREAFWMPHSSENFSASAGNSLYTKQRVIRVVRHSVSYFPFKINVLGSYLPIFVEFCQHLLTRHETPFSVGNRDGIHLVFHAFQPWRIIIHHLHIHHLGNMTPYRIVSECRRVFIQISYLPIRQKSRFYQGLEAVSYPQNHPVTLQKAMNS